MKDYIIKVYYKDNGAKVMEDYVESYSFSSENNRLHTSYCGEIEVYEFSKPVKIEVTEVTE